MNTSVLSGEQLDRLILLTERQLQLLDRKLLDLGFTRAQIDERHRAAVESLVPLEEGGTIDLPDGEYQLRSTNPDGSVALVKVKSAGSAGWRG